MSDDGGSSERPHASPGERDAGGHPGQRPAPVEPPSGWEVPVDDRQAPETVWGPPDGGRQVPVAGAALPGAGPPVPPAGWGPPPGAPAGWGPPPGAPAGWGPPTGPPAGWGPPTGPPAAPVGWDVSAGSPYGHQAPSAGWGGPAPGWPPPEPARRRGLPGWAIVLIVLGSVVLILGLILAVWGCNRVIDEIDKEEAALAGGRQIDAAILEYAADHAGRYPSPDEVGPAGDVADYVDEWPQNPFSGGPMVQGDDPGDFVYSLAPSGTGKPYTLSVYVSPWSPPDPTPI